MAEKTSPKAKTTKKIIKPKEEKAAKNSEVKTEVETDLKLAKAGKRSSKAIEEKELKIAKELKKQTETTDPDATKPKLKQKPARPKSERKGKKYKQALKLIDKTLSYSLDDALNLITKTSPTKFDATVELHIRLGVDPKHADQNIRDNIVLPSGTGKTIKVAVFADDKDLASAKKAGADIALSDSFLELLDKNKIDFDVLISTPSHMPKLAKYAKLLGPKGLMPNPKKGTVTNDPSKAVLDAKGGKVEYKIDSSGIIHLAIGKVSFGSEKLKLNAETVFESIKANKPSNLKLNYILSVFATTAMGPSVQIDKNI